MNVLTLLTLSAVLLLTACGGSSSNDIPPLYYEFKDLELTLEDIETPRLALGHNHTCFITSDEQVKCWGDNQHGQLGNGALSQDELYKKRDNGEISNEEYNEEINQFFSTTPVSVENISNAMQLSTGENHTCAIESINRQIYCWGKNNYRQLGNKELGDTNQSSSSYTPVLVNVDSLDKDRATAISVSGNYSCGIFETNGVQCWGEVPKGFDKKKLSEIFNSFNPLQLSISSRGYACALNRDGNIQCFGDKNTFKYFGATEGGPYVDGIHNALLVSGKGDHSCALLYTGRVKCWGYNLSGQVGVLPPSTQDKIIYTPSELKNIGEVTSLSAAGNNTCAVTQRGSVECWGANSGGQLGYLPPEKNSQNSHIKYYSSSPKVIELPSKFEAAEVAVGQSHICARARLTNDELYCWGKNDRGQLGNDKKLSDGSSNLSTLSTPVKVQL